MVVIRVPDDTAGNLIHGRYNALSSRRSVGEWSALRFQFFEAEEVKVVVGDDELKSLGKFATMRSAIASEGGKDFAGFQVPKLHCVVRGRRDRAPPCGRHNHSIYSTCVASEGGLSRPLPSSHIFRVWSRDTETAHCPSGVTVHELRIAHCHTNVR